MAVATASLENTQSVEPVIYIRRVGDDDGDGDGEHTIRIRHLYEEGGEMMEEMIGMEMGMEMETEEEKMVKIQEEEMEMMKMEMEGEIGMMEDAMK